MKRTLILLVTILGSIALGLVISSLMKGHEANTPNSPLPQTAALQDKLVDSPGEERFAECSDLGGTFWVHDRDGDGIVPELAIVNFAPNWICVLSGQPGSEFVRIFSPSQIGHDKDDIFGR